MLNRCVVVATITCLLSPVVEAQVSRLPAESRIRISGSRVFEIPGVLKADGDGVTGRSSMTTDDMTIRVVSPQTGHPLVVLKPGRRVVGRALDVKDRVLIFLLDGQHDPFEIPLDSIGTLEVSEHRSRHLVRGILIGVGVFYGTSALIFSAGCGLDCSNAMFLPTIASGIATGVITGKARDAWKSMPVTWLSAQFATP